MCKKKKGCESIGIWLFATTKIAYVNDVEAR